MKKNLLLLLCLFCLVNVCHAKAKDTFTVFQLNLWHGGAKVPNGDQGIIDVLVQVYGMSLKMISSYADIEEQEISDFLSGSNQMSYEKKYRLAVKTFSLMQAMRNM